MKATTYAAIILKAQTARSDKARNDYQETGDPTPVIDYFKQSGSGVPLSEPWLIKILQDWIKHDRHDLIKRLMLPGRGERANTRQYRTDMMIFAERIEKRRRVGKSLKEALLEELELFKIPYCDEELTKLKNKYQLAKKVQPKITIAETPETITISAFPSKVTYIDMTCFCEWSYTFPKK
jgi:hypothetical protein